MQAAVELRNDVLGLGSVSADLPSDVWSLGILLYELYASVPYWPAGTTPSTAIAALATPGMLPHEANTDKINAVAYASAQPQRLTELISAMLVRDPLQRPSAVDVLDSLRALMRSSGSMEFSAPLETISIEAQHTILEHRTASNASSATPM